MSTVTFLLKKPKKAVLHRKKQRIPRWNQLLLFCSVQIVLFVRFFQINKVGFAKADILCGEYGVFACLFLFFTEYIDYIFVNGIGKIYNPNNVTEAFGKLLKENGLRKIRFHDLRHSCASLLLANGVSLKEIQEWLGHSDIATTADIYSHLDFKSKISSAYLMDGVLNLPEPIIKEDWGAE